MGPPGSGCWGAAEGSSGAALDPAPKQAPLRCQDLYWRPPRKEGRPRDPINPSPRCSLGLRLPGLRFPSAPLVPGVPPSGHPLHPIAMGQGHFAPLPLKPGPRECSIAWCLAWEARSFRHPLPMPRSVGFKRSSPPSRHKTKGAGEPPSACLTGKGLRRLLPRPTVPCAGAAARGCLGKAGSTQPAPRFQLPSEPQQEANPYRAGCYQWGGEGRGSPTVPPPHPQAIPGPGSAMGGQRG